MKFTIGQHYKSFNTGLIVEYIGKGINNYSFTGKVIKPGNTYFHINQIIDFFCCEKFRELYQIH